MVLAVKGKVRLEVGFRAARTVARPRDTVVVAGPGADFAAGGEVTDPAAAGA